MKSKAEIVEALKRVPWQRVAEAINRKHLNGMLRRVPEIVFGDLSGYEDGMAACCWSEAKPQDYRSRMFLESRSGAFEPTQEVLKHPETWKDLTPRSQRLARRYAAILRGAIFRAVPVQITLDLGRIAQHIIETRGAVPPVAILTHELIHAIQHQKGYSGEHGSVFDDCCFYAAYSGLRVVGCPGYCVGMRVGGPDTMLYDGKSRWPRLPPEYAPALLRR